MSLSRHGTQEGDRRIGEEVGFEWQDREKRNTLFSIGAVRLLVVPTSSSFCPPLRGQETDRAFRDPSARALTVRSRKSRTSVAQALVDQHHPAADVLCACLGGNVDLGGWPESAPLRQRRSACAP